MRERWVFVPPWAKGRLSFLVEEGKPLLADVQLVVSDSKPLDPQGYWRKEVTLNWEGVPLSGEEVPDLEYVVERDYFISEREGDTSISVSKEVKERLLLDDDGVKKKLAGLLKYTFELLKEGMDKSLENFTSALNGLSAKVLETRVSYSYGVWERGDLKLSLRASEGGGDVLYKSDRGYDFLKDPQRVQKFVELCEKVVSKEVRAREVLPEVYKLLQQSSRRLTR